MQERQRNTRKATKGGSAKPAKNDRLGVLKNRNPQAPKQTRPVVKKKR